MGVTVQGEHDGPEEDRSDPEGRGARGPARPMRGARHDLEKGVEPPSPVVASRKTWVIWNCVHQAKKHLRGPMMF